uniref:Putative LAGLIDADG homing endonuclease n=1 Tax=Rhexinema sarcinoideum TaxID=43261 RepID=A0A1B2RYX3_9CHLO|nr:putative LAGLIDADG homing endonuclease [Rhexinema sarcinoideum]
MQIIYCFSSFAFYRKRSKHFSTFMKLNGQNNNLSLQSAGNQKESSETTRQFSKATHSKTQFASWLAGVISGSGNFDMKIVAGKLKLKSIRIKLHLRSVEILNYTQNQLQFGKIYPISYKPYCIYQVNAQKETSALINMINGQIRLLLLLRKSKRKWMGLKKLDIV